MDLCGGIRLHILSPINSTSRCTYVLWKQQHNVYPNVCIFTVYFKFNLTELMSFAIRLHHFLEFTSSSSFRIVYSLSLLSIFGVRVLVFVFIGINVQMCECVFSLFASASVYLIFYAFSICWITMIWRR